LEPTRTVSFKGPQTSGTLFTFRIPFACYLVHVRTMASGAIFSRGIAWAAVPASSFMWHVIGVSNAGTWVGRMRFEKDDSLYVDSIGGLGTSDLISFTFVEDIAHPSKFQ
jgi:hypothetical protein